MKTLLTADEIRHGVSRLGREIESHYAGRPLTLIGVLTGSVVLLADLMRELTMPLRLGVIQARSYRGATTKPGELVTQAEFLPEVRGQEVLLVDDIFDTGQTLATLVQQLHTMQPASVRSAVLLRKSVMRDVSLEPDHVVFDIPDEFVVG
jgi:hypoxanthine phosphoribosyltransferase